MRVFTHRARRVQVRGGVGEFLRLAASARVGAGGGYSVAARSIARVRVAASLRRATPTRDRRAVDSRGHLRDAPVRGPRAHRDERRGRGESESVGAFVDRRAASARGAREQRRRRATRRRRAGGKRGGAPARERRVRLRAAVPGVALHLGGAAKGRGGGEGGASRRPHDSRRGVRRRVARRRALLSPPHRRGVRDARARGARRRGVPGRRRGGRRRGDQGADAAALHPSGVEARGRGASGRVCEEHGSPSVRGRRRVQDGGGERKVVDVDGRSAVPVFARGAPRAGRRAPPPPPQASPRRAGRPDRSPRRRGAAPVDVSPRDPRAAAARRLRGGRRRATRLLERVAARRSRAGTGAASPAARTGSARRRWRTSYSPWRPRSWRRRRRATVVRAAPPTRRRALSRVLAGAGAASQSRRVRAAAAALTPPPRDVPRLDAAVEAHARDPRGSHAREAGGVRGEGAGASPSLRRAAIRAGVREALERAREFAKAAAPPRETRGASRARDGVRGRNPDGARRELLAAIGPLSFGHDDSVVRSGLPGAPFAEPSAAAAALAPPPPRRTPRTPRSPPLRSASSPVCSATRPPRPSSSPPPPRASSSRRARRDPRGTSTSPPSSARSSPRSRPRTTPTPRRRSATRFERARRRRRATRLIRPRRD